MCRAYQKPRQIVEPPKMATRVFRRCSHLCKKHVLQVLGKLGTLTFTALSSGFVTCDWFTCFTLGAFKRHPPIQLALGRGYALCQMPWQSGTEETISQQMDAHLWLIEGWDLSEVHQVDEALSPSSKAKTEKKKEKKKKKQVAKLKFWQMGVSFRRFPTRWWASFWFSFKTAQKKGGGVPRFP